MVSLATQSRSQAYVGRQGLARANTLTFFFICRLQRPQTRTCVGAEREAAWAPAQEVENESNVGRFVGEIYKGDERGSGWEEGGGAGAGERAVGSHPLPPPVIIIT